MQHWLQPYKCLYLERVLGNVDTYEYTRPVVHEDNQETIAPAENPGKRQRAKHVDKKHFTRSALSEGRVTLVYCSTDDMVADVMTKPVNKFKLKKFKAAVFGV